MKVDFPYVKKYIVRCLWVNTSRKADYKVNSNKISNALCSKQLHITTKTLLNLLIELVFSLFFHLFMSLAHRRAIFANIIN